MTFTWDNFFGGLVENKPNLTEQGLILAPLGPVRRNSYADFDEVMT